MIPLASTGTEIINSIDVIIIAQQNKFSWYIFVNFVFIKIIETIKFIDLRIDDRPLRWIDIIVKLTVKLFWIINGGYIVHPVLILFIIIILIINILVDGIRIQNLRLFIRGKIKSIELIIRGMNQFLVLPIMIGIVIKKIMISACNVISE